MSPAKKEKIKPESEFETTDYKEISYDAIIPDVSKQLKEEKIEATVEKAIAGDQEPEPTEAEEIPTPQEFKEDVAPLMEMLFKGLNDILDAAETPPFTPEEQEEILKLASEFLFKGEPPAFLKDLKGSSFKIRVAAFALFHVIPRIVFLIWFYTKKKVK